MNRSEMHYTPQFRIKGVATRPTLQPEDTKLFVVYAQGKGSFPLTCYAFGATADRALYRVQVALTAVIEAEQIKSKGDLHDRQLKHLMCIKNAKWSAHEVDHSDILTASQVWADNDGIEVS